MRNEFSSGETTVDRRQRGAAAIFIVIFFAILTSVITLSFVSITNQESQQALNDDLSRSAYDAAKAGVVDANRALTYCEKHDPDKAACLARFQNKCADVAGFAARLELEADDNDAVLVGQGADRKLNQSYTCAKVDLTPKTIALNLEDQQMRIIELKSAASIGAIRVKWFDNQENQGQPMSLPKSPLLDKKLPKTSSDPGWGGETTPPILRVQLVNPGPNPDVASFPSNVSAAFLYPADSTTVNPGGALAPGQPVKAPCDATTYENGQPACQADLTVSIPANTSAYLILMPIYNKTNLEIQGLTAINGTPLGLEGYPSIDVTGKAGDLFRRVRSTIDLHGKRGNHDMPGFDTTKTLCKNFAVTDQRYFVDSDVAPVCEGAP